MRAVNNGDGTFHPGDCSGSGRIRIPNPPYSVTNWFTFAVDLDYVSAGAAPRGADDASLKAAGGGLRFMRSPKFVCGILL